jgi:hypothetical protein
LARAIGTLQFRLRANRGAHQSEFAMADAISSKIRRRNHDRSTAPCRSPDTAQSPTIVAKNQVVISQKAIID